jgi:hypothetical protein
MSEVLRLIDGDARLVPEATDTLLASDPGVAPMVIKGAGEGSLSAFADLIIDADALDAEADPMENWGKDELDAVYDQIAFMAAQRDLLHGVSVVYALRKAGLPA